MKMTIVEKYFVNGPRHARNVADHALDLLSRVAYQPGWRYLDVGCGIGSAAHRVAASSNLGVTGIDVDPEQIAAAQTQAARSNLRFRVMDATKLDFGDGQFDIVATSMATHHIPNWQKAFSEMVRTLRPGGCLICSDFMFPSWLSGADKLIPFVSLPSKTDLDSLAVGVGLTKVYEARRFLRVDAIFRKETRPGVPGTKSLSST